MILNFENFEKSLKEISKSLSLDIVVGENNIVEKTIVVYNAKYYYSDTKYYYSDSLGKPLLEISEIYQSIFPFVHKDAMDAICIIRQQRIYELTSQYISTLIKDRNICEANNKYLLGLNIPSGNKDALEYMYMDRDGNISHPIFLNNNKRMYPDFLFSKQEIESMDKTGLKEEQV